MFAMTRILIIDDEPALRELMCEVVENEQSTAIALESADDGLIFLEQHAGSVDLVITDVRVPGVLSGYDLAIQIRRKWPDLPVIITSGYYDEQSECKPVNSNFLPKPWAMSELLEMIGSCLKARKG